MVAKTVRTKCPSCGEYELNFVRNTRLQKTTGFIQRHRKCGKCGAGWATIEVPLEMKTRLMDVEKLFQKSRKQVHISKGRAISPSTRKDERA